MADQVLGEGKERPAACLNIEGKKRCHYQECVRKDCCLREERDKRKMSLSGVCEKRTCLPEYRGQRKVSLSSVYEKRTVAYLSIEEKERCYCQVNFSSCFP